MAVGGWYATARWGAIAAIVALALAMRIAITVPAMARPPADPDNYLPLAQSIAAGDGLTFAGRPTAYRPPLYPLVLAPLVWMSSHERSIWPGLASLHWLLGAATVACTAVAANRLGLGTRGMILAAFLVGLDPVLASLARSIMTETLAAFLLAVSLLALTGRRAWAPFLGGPGFGAAVLCRPSLLAGAALCCLAGLVVGADSLGSRVRRGGLVALGILLTLLPWAVRNARVFGTPIWTTTHGGYTLYLANNSVYYEKVVEAGGDIVWSGAQQHAWFVSLNERAAGLSEPEADRLFARLALDAARANPRAFLRASWKRLERFWGVAPSAAVYSSRERWSTAVWTVPFWLLVLVGAFRRGAWTWPAVAAPMVVVGLTIVHVFFWTDLRMRAPLVPALALIAARATVPGKRARMAPNDDIAV